MTEQDITKAAKALEHLLNLQNTLDTYGGFVTDDEWADRDIYKFAIVRSLPRNELRVISVTLTRLPLTFHTREQAERFMNTFAHKIKEYYMF